MIGAVSSPKPIDALAHSAFFVITSRWWEIDAFASSSFTRAWVRFASVELFTSILLDVVISRFAHAGSMGLQNVITRGD
jgi:hypothetical protein